MSKKLHVVSFDVPYPPDYGGVVDVYYKIKALSEIGIQIYLHVFEYGRGRHEELNQLCEKVFYYPRSKNLGQAMHLTPFIVISRKSNDLIKNLNSMQAPVLFEGLHTLYPIKKKLLNDKILLLRMHNVEHEYAKGLAKNESSPFKKMFYWLESLKLKHFEKNLKKGDHILSISPKDQEYYKETLSLPSVYLPAFHSNSKISQQTKKGYFALYHGNLSVRDNLKAANYLIDLFRTIDIPLIIAGRTANKKILQKIDEVKNIQFIPLKDESQLKDLIQRAHVNILVSFQSSGLKLKLLNALFNGRFVLVNPNIIEGSGLEDLCEVAETKKIMIEKVIQLMDHDFSEESFSIRKQKLKEFDNRSNAQKITALLEG